MPPCATATTYTGADGPMALAMGTTVRCSFAASSLISPACSIRSAASRSGAQSSATTAARTERRSGSHISAQPMGGPQCRIVPSSRPPMASPAVSTASSTGTPLSRRRITSALAASTRSEAGPNSRANAAIASASPPAGMRQSTPTADAPWSRTAVSNRSRPMLTTSTFSGSFTGGLMPLVSQHGPRDDHLIPAGDANWQRSARYARKMLPVPRTARPRRGSCHCY